jgi:hypothetical protein
MNDDPTGAVPASHYVLNLSLIANFLFIHVSEYVLHVHSVIFT